jgi:hypothetical protein
MLEKIKPLGQLREIASQARAKGQKVVLAHGVFDIMSGTSVISISTAAWRHPHRHADHRQVRQQGA